ncbi:MAG: LUD domain-containing protein [Bacteroidales bacterium]|nr:LUD domain-containing protein [Bacteroidales bacterium]
MAWDNKRENEDTTYKEQILAKVRNALIEKPEALFKDIDQRSETWVPIKEEDGTAVTFVQNFKEHGGIFIYLDTETDFSDCLKQLASENEWEPLWCTSPSMQKMLTHYGIPYTTGKTREAKQKLVSLTDCECLVAQTGSIVFSDILTQSRQAYALPDVLLVFATTKQIVNGMKDVFVLLKKKYQTEKPSQVAIITGPSRTTEIEQTLVIGASGIRQVAVFLVEED